MIFSEDIRDVLVTKEDALALGYCMARIRPFCIANQIDFRSFVENGVKAELLLPSNDQYAIDMIEHALERTDGQ